MARNRDNAPVGNTCPKIDEVISLISQMDYEFTDEDNEDKKQKESAANVLLEQIRSDNSQLREWGNAEYLRAEENERERDDLLKQVETLKSDIDYYIKQNGILSDENSELQYNAKYANQ